MLEGPDHPEGDAANFLALNAYFTSIGGGTDQIQRNIIGERVLGLPKEPEVDRDVPFRTSGGPPSSARRPATRDDGAGATLSHPLRRMIFVTVRHDTMSGQELRSEDLEQYRRELTGYCYRMLGSAFEAEDAVQETMVRAWKGIDGFEGRSAVRSWLYRIATNVCLDQLRGRQRRATPMDLGPAGTVESFLGATRPENTWVQPIPDGHVMLADSDDPAEVAAARETIRLAFVTALQHLPARQRAVLILREVLRWQATEVAELLDTTVASVNSALQRARATLADHDRGEADVAAIDPEEQALVARYVDAFERYDIASLVALLHDDAVMSMPPVRLLAPGSPRRWATGSPGPGADCEGSHLVPLAANGCAAFAQYRPDGQGGHTAWSIQVLEVSGGRIVGHHNFLDLELFEVFGLPRTLRRLRAPARSAPSGGPPGRSGRGGRPRRRAGAARSRTGGPPAGDGPGRPRRPAHRRRRW